MSKEIARTSVPSRRFRLSRRNTMAFPRELRQAIPDLHAGRVLEIDSVSSQATNLFEPLVELRIQVKETGKLKGKYVIAIALQSDAARKLAATLVELADQIDK